MIANVVDLGASENPEVIFALDEAFYRLEQHESDNNRPLNSNVNDVDKAKFKQTMLRNSLLWGWAFLTPPVVMVVLDIFDKHTPNNIALFSTFMLMIPFLFANKLVATALAPFVTDEESK